MGEILGFKSPDHDRTEVPPNVADQLIRKLWYALGEERQFIIWFELSDLESIHLVQVLPDPPGMEKLSEDVTRRIFGSIDTGLSTTDEPTT